MINAVIRKPDGQKRMLITSVGRSIPTEPGEVIESVEAGQVVIIEDVDVDVGVDVNIGVKGFRLGDAVAKVTRFVGIKPCQPCKERQEYLNKLSDKLLGKSEDKDKK